MDYLSQNQNQRDSKESTNGFDSALDQSSSATGQSSEFSNAMSFANPSDAMSGQSGEVSSAIGELDKDQGSVLGLSEKADKMGGRFGSLAHGLMQRAEKAIYGEALLPSYRSKKPNFLSLEADRMRSRIEKWKRVSEATVESVFGQKTKHSSFDTEENSNLEKSRAKILEKIRFEQKSFYVCLFQFEHSEGSSNDKVRNMKLAEGKFKRIKDEFDVRIQAFRDTVTGEYQESTVVERASNVKKRLKGSVSRSKAEIAVQDLIKTVPKIESMCEDNISWVKQMQKDQMDLESTLVGKTVEATSRYLNGTKGSERWDPILESLARSSASISSTRSHLYDVLKTWKNEGKDIIDAKDLNICLEFISRAWFHQSGAFNLVRKELNEDHKDKKSKEGVAEGYVTTFKTIEAFSNAAAVILLTPAGGPFVLKSFAKFAIKNIGYRVIKRAAGEGISSALGWSETKGLKEWAAMLVKEAGQAGIDSLARGFSMNAMPFFQSLGKLPESQRLTLIRKIGIDFMGEWTKNVVSDVCKLAIAGEEIKILEIINKSAKDAALDLIINGAINNKIKKYDRDIMKGNSDLASGRVRIRKGKLSRLEKKFRHLNYKIKNTTLKETSGTFDRVKNVALIEKQVKELNEIRAETTQARKSLFDATGHAKVELSKLETLEKNIDVLLKGCEETLKGPTDMLLPDVSNKKEKDSIK